MHRFISYKKKRDVFYNAEFPGLNLNQGFAFVLSRKVSRKFFDNSIMILNAIASSVINYYID